MSGADLKNYPLAQEQWQAREQILDRFEAACAEENGRALKISGWPPMNPC